MSHKSVTELTVDFLAHYDAEAKDAVWQQQSAAFRNFWTMRVMAPGADALSDEECDAVIQILDRHGKGNTNETEAVAHAMVPQGAWRKMFNEFRANKQLGGLVYSILEEASPVKKAELIDQLYEENALRKNRLTGPSGNVIGAFLAAYDPVSNLSVISLKDRKALCELLDLAVPFDWETSNIGLRIVKSNSILLEGLRACGFGPAVSARTVTVFCYQDEMLALWKNGNGTTRRESGKVTGTRGKANASPWWMKFFDSEEQSHAAFDLIHEACSALGVEDTRGATAQRVSFTNTKSGAGERLRLSCGNTLVLEVSERQTGDPNSLFIARVEEQGESFVSGGRFSTPYAGHNLGLCSIDLADLLEAGSASRKLFFNALGDVAATYKNIKKRHHEQAHRPRLLYGAFHPEARIELFATGPTRGPSPDPEPGSNYSKADALQDLFMPEEVVDRVISMLKRKKNIILQGAPGTGKTFVARRLAYLLMGEKDPSRAPMVQFHQSTAYEDFIQGYRPDGDGGFELKNGVFHAFCENAAADDNARPYVFIIDEINRGNLSKILGELMMLIEPDKRGAEFSVPLTYATSHEETFHVPDNVFLIGTMNTADRSLSMVDYALRRRFAFIEAEPGFSSKAFATHLTGRGASSKLVAAIQERMEMVNALITHDTANLGRGYRIGHSFFVPAKDTKPDAAWYQDIVRHEILPLIEEYWIDDEKSRVAASTILLQPIES